MPIVRSSHAFDSAFTQVPNAWVRDPKLSLKAIGLLVQLMSHSPGWSVSIRSLATANSCGLDLIRSAVSELESAGYLKRQQNRAEAGRFGEVTWITTDPAPSSGLPSSGFPTSVNPTTKNTKIKEEQTKEVLVQAELGQAFREFWEIYPRKEKKPKAEAAFYKYAKEFGVEVILAGARRYRDDPNREKAFTRIPESWLNGNCWEDDLLPARELSKEALAEKAKEEARRRAEVERKANDKLLEEMRIREAEAKAKPPTLCEHERIIHVCRICSRKSSTTATSNN